MRVPKGSTVSMAAADKKTYTMVTSIRMDRTLHRDAKVFAANNSLSLQALFERALREYLARHSHND